MSVLKIGENAQAWLSVYLQPARACKGSLLKCRFKLKALAGHSKAGQKVTFGALKGAKFKQLALVLLPAFLPSHDGSYNMCVYTHSMHRIMHVVSQKS